MQYLARNIKYPTIAQKNKEQGRVILQMIVGKDGSISNIKVLRSISPLLDAEAIRVVSTMPKWEPGQQGGQAIAVEYTLPSFQITINISPVPRLLPHTGGDKAFIGIGKKIHLFLLF